MEQSIVEFFYFDQRFTIDLSLFNQHSNYFLQDEHAIKAPIYFVTEFDPKLQHPEETINSFIEYFEKSQINITHKNAFSIQFLSRKFDISTLSKIASEYIAKEEHEQKLLDEIFSHTENLYHEQEDFISSKFEKIITDDRLSSLTISQLYRIITKYLTQFKIQEYHKKEEKILPFLNKLIERKGNESFTIITLFQFSKRGRKQIYEQLKNTKINCIEKNLIDSIIDIDSYQERKEKEASEEKQKMNEYYENKFSIFYEKMENKIDELRQEMKEQERSQNEQNEYLKKIIININDFYSNPNYEMFNKLLPESQNMIISNIKNNEAKENEQIDNIYNLVNYLWGFQLKSKHQFDNNQLIYIETRDNKQKFSATQRIEKVAIPSAMIKILISNSSNYEAEFINIINKFEDIYVDLEYPSTENQQIIDSIIKVKKSEEFKLKTEIRIIKIEPQEKPFQHNKFIDSIIIEPSNKIIPGGFEQGYFEYCTSLEKVIIPESVTTIGGGAFYSCFKLNEIRLPKSVSIIESGAFSGCSSLTEIILPATITFISDCLFQNCSTLKSIVIPSSVTSIGNYSFSGCTSITEIIIPGSVITIGNYSFSGCKSLTRITIPSTVENIGESCFEGCISIEFTDNMIVIPNNMFNGCTSLTNIIIPTTIQNIGKYSFSGCSSLTQITIPSSVTSIGYSAFSGCSSLAQITFEIPSSVTSIGNYSFSGCSSLTQITIPSSVISIGDYAFSECSSLTQITIPSSVTSIGDYAFEECSSLTQITIPSSVTSIGDYAFRGCSSLTQITIPSSVTSIGNSSFSGCSSLTLITFEIPSSVASIGDYAFRECSSLTQITIPSSVTSIGDSSFSGCSSLTQITNLSSVKLNIIVLAFANKKHQNKASIIRILKTGTMYDVKKRLLHYFIKHARSTITEFILVTKGPPEDTYKDTIEDNYFDDKYNNKTIGDFLKINEEKQIYTEEYAYSYADFAKSVPLIYYRDIRLKLNIRILNMETEMMVSLPLGLENSYSSLISNIHSKTQLKIEDPYHIFQDNQNLDEISKDENMKKYSKTGLILFLYPIQAQFINTSNNLQTTILLKHDKPLSFYLPEILHKLMIENYSTNYIFHIQDQQEENPQKIGIDIPIHQILKKQKEEPVIFKIFEDD